MFPALLTTILFSISAVSAQRTTRAMGGIRANFFRILVATALLGIWSHLFGNGLRGPGLWMFLLSGCVGFGIGDLALYQTLPRLGSRLSIMIVHCLAAPIAAVVEWLWLGTKLTLPEILCSVTVLTGVAFALAPHEHTKLAPRVVIAGTAFGILAAAGQGMGAVLSRRAYEICLAAGMPIAGLNAGVTAAYQRIWGGVAVAGISMIVARYSRGVQPPPDTRIWPWVLANAMAGPGLGVACYQWALATTPTGVVLPIVALTPLVIIPFARFVEGERPTGRSLAGGVIAVLGVIGLRLAMR